MTKVFVHYKAALESSEPTNVELLFSRVPVVGEIVFFEQKSYEVCRVDHYPERKQVEAEMKGYPEDAEVWLVEKDVPATPPELGLDPFLG